jgi:N-acetylmuramoyl-L-alanine amidase
VTAAQRDGSRRHRISRTAGAPAGRLADLRLPLAVAGAGLLACACGAGSAPASPAATSRPAVSAPARTAAVAAAAASGPARSATPGSVATGSVATGSASGAARSGGSRPLAGKIIGIDPGHNGRNRDDPGYINRLIWNGREWETCDTTGTETDGGYTEARYNFNVASYLRADLRRDGAKVVMTRTNNHGVGPCVNRRAAIINRAHANVAVDIHADGGPPGGRGFTVLEPVADGPNDKVIRSSERFGRAVRSAFLADTKMPVSDYYGVNGIIHRDDLAGLNLTRVPKILIECGNMRNAKDAALLTSTHFQRRVARALEAAIIAFLRGARR